VCLLLTDAFSGSAPLLASAANNLCWPDSLPSNVTDNTSVVEKAHHDGGTVKLERMSSEQETSLLTDDFFAVDNDISSQAVADVVVDGSKSLEASEVRGGTAEVCDDSSGMTAVDQLLYATPAAAPVQQDRCIHCNELRPLQVCPVCHYMYPSVAMHIGVHSIRKKHRPTL